MSAVDRIDQTSIVSQLPPEQTNLVVAQASSTAGLKVPDDVLLLIRFRTLVAEWRHATDHISSLTRTVMHPSYQKIIGMGPDAIPLVLDELKSHGGHWFWALRALTQQNPADGCVEFEAARKAWLEWGKREGHIS